MAITKNYQTEERLKQMALTAYPKLQVDSITELTEGMCNAAYLFTFHDGSKSVLKIAAENRQGRMTNERNLMETEVKAMRLLEQTDSVRVAKIHYYDTSHMLCDADYFFMEALPGKSLYSMREELTEEEKNRIHYEIGLAEHAISEIRGEKFGLLGEQEHTHETLYAFVYELIGNVLSDADKKQVVIGVDAEEILTQLCQDKAAFDEVKKPALVHWDMWEGNLFIYEKHLAGIIDWERAMWGEAFMDDRFRRHTRHPEFLRGYGQTSFSQNEMRRILWYDVLLYLTMMTEGAYREYEDDSQYQWIKPLFEASWNELTLNC